jgi:NAD(P) transhydrogenase subunit alpha
MKIAVLTEQAEGETRVALVPETIGRLSRAGHAIQVQSGAGDDAGFPDSAYEGVGAVIAPDAAGALSGVELLPLVGPPPEEVLGLLPSGTVLAGMFRAAASEDLLKQLAESGITAFSMELIPRIARAQRADVLSSQASLAGYKAVLMAADTIGKFLPMMMTAAGTIPPARVLILGAGVAGLQAIATARRLGAIVEAFDVRAATREQVESLGATFVETPAADAQAEGGYARELGEDEQARQRALIAEHAATSDAIITTAAIPNRPAPLLITADAVRAMQPGSVIVDLAAETGGNCELTEPGKTITVHGVTIHGPFNVPASMPFHASQMYSRNLAALLELIIGDEGLNLDFTDEVVRQACVTHGGRVVYGDQDSLIPPEQASASGQQAR